MSNITTSVEPSMCFGRFNSTVNVFDRNNGGTNILKWADSPMESLDLSHPLNILIAFVNMVVGRALLVNITDGTTSHYHVIKRSSLNKYFSNAQSRYSINGEKPAEFFAWYFFQTIHIANKP